MRKTGKYLWLIPAVAALLLVMAILPLGVACQATPSSPLDFEKALPAYTLHVEFPDEIWAVTLGKGESVTLPVAIESLVDVPVAIRLYLEANIETPEFVTYEAQEEFMALDPWDTIDSDITIIVSSNAIPGDYIFCIRAELEEPVAERSGVGICFTLTIAAI